MKYSYLLCLIFFIPVCAESQTKVVAMEDAAFESVFKSAKSIPIVKGKLLNISSEEIADMTISYSLITPFYNTQVKKTTKVSKDGSFSLVLDYSFPYQHIFFQLGDRNLFFTVLIANKDLFLELDFQKIKSQKNLSFNGEGVKYIGTDGPATSYFDNYTLYSQKERIGLIINFKKATLGKVINENEFMQQYDELYTTLAKIDQTFILEHPSPYSWMIENQRLSDYFQGIFSRNLNKSINPEIWEKMLSHKAYMLSSSSMSFYNSLFNSIKAMPINRVAQASDLEILALPGLSPEELSTIDSIKYFSRIKPDIGELKRVKQKLAPYYNKIFYEKSATKLISFLDSVFPSPKADFLKLQMGSRDPEEQKIFYEKALASMKTDWCKKVLNIEYKNTIDKITSINKSLSQSVAILTGTGLGEPLLETPFGAKLYKINKMKAAEFLINLKQIYPNKALLLDFWATWCGPCLREMPYGKKLHEQTKNLPINYIYICTTNNSDEAKWKAKVIELEQPGIHFFVDEGTVNELMSQFGFSGYPSYAFINKKGVYKPGAIIRMSETNIRKLTALVAD